jgi:hypothetical protein
MMGVTVAKFNKKDRLAPYGKAALPRSKLRFDVFWVFLPSIGLVSLKNPWMHIRNAAAKRRNAATKLNNCSVHIKN